MTTAQMGNRKPLRLWPGVVVVVLQWLAWFVLPRLVPEAALYGVLGGVLGGGLAVVVWWLFFSRAPWLERVGALILMPVAVYVTAHLIHESIAGGAMGMLFPLLAIPVLSLALVVGAAAGLRLPSGPRRAVLTAGILLACGAFTLLRTGGLSGEGDSDLHWRWSPTPEERLLALSGDEPAAAGEDTPGLPGTSPALSTGRAHVGPGAEPALGAGLPTPPPSMAAATAAQWPGFRGADRDGIVHGFQIATDWSRFPPVELWRRPIGPGWSSFAVGGSLLYTQEQRGKDEVVACYRLTTGQPVWRHRDAARFWESNAGAGPRATPTLANGRVYTCGATGIMNVLDASSGAVVWSRNAAADTGVKVPNWGFAGSPLIVDDLVIIATAGRLVAYDRTSGEPRWLGPVGGGGYSSPHLATLGGIEQILLLNGDGAIAVAPATGAQLWQHSWPSDGIVQPALSTDGDVLIGTGSGMGEGAGLGLRRIAVAHESGGWTTRERWTSAGIKPYFNDFVVHQGHAYGFDGTFLACIDLADGTRKWKGGRYGHGQVILLADQGLLLVLSEKGELALVAASADQFHELARLPAIAGKTWNHPVLAEDVLLVRNDQEMAAFRLSPAGR
jgi:outer membrane protein assembly factor BamB